MNLNTKIKNTYFGICSQNAYLTYFNKLVVDEKKIEFV